MYKLILNLANYNGVIVLLFYFAPFKEDLFKENYNLPEEIYNQSRERNICII